MKKLILLGILAVTSVCAINLSGFAETRNNQATWTPGCTYGQCSATAKSTGERCRNCCQEGSSYCWSHR